jgi:drug/metabolite transporter (DMT)-like permease
MAHHSQTAATLVGLVAIGFSASLALLSTRAAGIPPFQLLAMNAAIAFVAGLLFLAARGKGAWRVLKQPLRPWIMAVLAIFTYHAAYFYAVSSIPPARASLIAYLWPLLIVVFASLASGGGGVRWGHGLGALLGLAGVVVLFADKSATVEAVGPASGYVAAFACALIWSGYSVLNRRYSGVPSEMLIGVCGAVAVLSALSHLVFETSVSPTPGQWWAIVLLGIGPIGLTFLSWDHATKHGNIALLGVISFSTPILSTALLVLAGEASATIYLGLAAMLVVTGAMAASRAGRDRHSQGRANSRYS